MKKELDTYGVMQDKTRVHEDSEVPCFNPPAQNEFEKEKWNSNGFDQSGMKKGK